MELLNCWSRSCTDVFPPVWWLNGKPEKWSRWGSTSNTQRVGGTDIEAPPKVSFWVGPDCTAWPRMEVFILFLTRNLNSKHSSWAKPPFQNIKMKLWAVTIHSLMRSLTFNWPYYFKNNNEEKWLILKTKWYKKGENFMVYFENTEMKHLPWEKYFPWFSFWQNSALRSTRICE